MYKHLEKTKNRYTLIIISLIIKVDVHKLKKKNSQRKVFKLQYLQLQCLQLLQSLKLSKSVESVVLGR